MRNFLYVTVLALLASAASGCACRHWRPGQLLFGRAAQTTTVCVPAAPTYCDPCGGTGGGVISSGMISSGTVIDGDSCCQ